MRVVSGKRGINSMTIFVPDLMAELTPSKCAAGFKVGECFDTVEELIGVVEWYDKDSTLDQRISSNIGWMGVVSWMTRSSSSSSVVQGWVIVKRCPAGPSAWKTRDSPPLIA